MKLGFLELMDTSGLSEENKKFFESLDEKMGEAFEKQVKGYLADEVKLEDLRKSIKDAADSINDIKEKDFAGMNYGALKEAVCEAVISALEPLQSRFQEIRADKEFLNRLMGEGAEKAAKTAYKTLAKVQRKVGFGPKKF